MEAGLDIVVGTEACVVVANDGERGYEVSTITPAGGDGVSTAEYIQITDAPTLKSLCGPFNTIGVVAEPGSISLASGGGVHVVNVGFGEGAEFDLGQSNTFGVYTFNTDGTFTNVCK